MRRGGMIPFQIFHQSPGAIDGPTEPVGHREKKEPYRGNQHDRRDGELQESGERVQTRIGDRMHFHKHSTDAMMPESSESLIGTLTRCLLKGCAKRIKKDP